MFRLCLEACFLSISQNRGGEMCFVYSREERASGKRWTYELKETYKWIGDRGKTSCFMFWLNGKGPRRRAAEGG